jgi:hypothetical protein
MPIGRRVISFLEENNINYFTCITHLVLISWGTLL